MNSTTNGHALSEFLKEMVSGNVLDIDTALEANQLPTHELQEEAVEISRDHKKVMRLVVQAVLPVKSDPHPNPPPPQGEGEHPLSLRRERASEATGEGQPGNGRFYGAARNGVQAAGKALKENPKVRRFLLWTIGMMAVSWVLAFVGRWAHHAFVRHPGESRGPATSTPLDSVPYLGKYSSGQSPVGDGLQSAGMTKTVFQITSAKYADKNKMELHWNSLGDGYTYRIFENCHPEDADEKPVPLTDRVLTSPGARVNMNYQTGCASPVLQVMPLAPSGASEPMSDPVRFRLSPLNDAYSVEPIAMEAATAVNQEGGQPAQRATQTAAKGGPIKKGYLSPPSRSSRLTGHTAVTAPPVKKPSYISAFAQQLLKNADGTIASVVPYQAVGQGLIAAKNAAVSATNEASPTTSASPAASLRPLPAGEGGRLGDPGEATLPAPTGLKAQVTGPLAIHFTWKPVPGCAGYNFYSAKKGDPTPTKETQEPLLSPWGNWTSDTGPGEFRFAVRALDAQGRESANSNILQMEVQ